MKVKINCTLVYGNREKVFSGHIFEGKLEDFHEDIQALVKKGCPYIEVIEDAPKPVKKETVKVELKKVSKPKKLVKKSKK